MTDAAAGAVADAAAKDAQDKGGDAAKSGTNGDDAGKTFSQADLDRIVETRLARERQKYEGFDDLKKKAEEYDKLEEAQKTELQKAQDRATKAEADAKAASDRAKETALRAAIISEAAKKNVVDPDAAVALLDKSAIEYDKDGSPTNIADAVDSLLKAKPYLVGGGSRGDADQGARNGGANQLTREQLQTMSHAEIVKAQDEGRLDHMLGAETRS